MRTSPTSSGPTERSSPSATVRSPSRVPRAEGYLASALMNYLALLGWSYDDKTTVMSRDELVERFSLDRVGSSPATFDYAKLDWLNGVYLRDLPPDAYADELVAYLREQGSRATSRRSAPRRRSSRRRSRGSRSIRPSPASSFAASSRRPSSWTAPARCLTRPARRSPGSSRSRPSGSSLPSAELAERLELKPREAFGPIRAAVTGSRVSPGPLREPRAPRPRGVARPPEPLAVEDEAACEQRSPAAQTGQAASTAPAVKRKAPLITSPVATIAERNVLSLPSPRLRACVAVGAERHRRPLERTQSGKPDAEERPAPLGEQGVDELDVAALERVADLGRDVPGLGERGDELVVQGLGSWRRLDAHGELCPACRLYWKLRKLVEKPVGEPFGRGLRDPLEADERRAYALPEMRNGFRIPPGSFRRTVRSIREASYSVAVGGDRRSVLLRQLDVSVSGRRPALDLARVPLHVLAPAQRSQHEQDGAEADCHVDDRDHELLAEAEREDGRAGGSAGEREDEDRRWVPAPPGVNGSIVERPWTTSTASVVSAVASTWKARRKKKVDPTRATQLPACQDTTSRA